MSAPKRRKTSDKLALRIARAQLRAIRWVKPRPTYGDLATGFIASESHDPARFIQCWAVGRGYSGITQALDSAGQVWERVSLMEDVQVDGAKKKVLKDSWWEPLSMQRKALKDTT